MFAWIQRLFNKKAPKQRSIVDVINAILEEIPDKQYAYLRASLQKIKDGSKYTAPESMGLRWNELVMILSDELDEPDGDFMKQRIADIMTGVHNS